MTRRTQTEFPDHEEGKVPGLEEAFAVVLRRLRKARGWSQQEVGFRSDLGRVYLSLLERAQRRPSLSTVFQLSRALGVEPEEFIRMVAEELRKK